MRVSIQPLGDRAVDDERARTEPRTTGTGQNPILDQCQDAEFFCLQASKASGDRVLRPLVRLGLPQWAVVGGNGGNAAQHIVGTMAIGERCH